MNDVIITLLFLFFAVVMFALEKIPLTLTSMIVCTGLILTGVLTPAQGFAGFVSPTVILFVGMFIVGGALFETGMASNIGSIIAKLKFVKTERQLIIVVMVLSAMMSLFLSNTGTAAVLIPIIAGVSVQTGVPRSKLFIPMAFAVTMGGFISLIGSPPNMIAHAALENATGRGFRFFELGLIGIPITVVGIIYFALIGYKFLPNRAPQGDTGEALQQAVDYSQVPAWKRFLSLGILLGTVTIMIFEARIGIPLHVASSIGALLLVLTGVITEKQAFKAIDLKVVFLFGGMLALAAALETSGTGIVIAQAVINLLGEESSPFLLLLVILLLSASLTQFMSSTATAALVVPICLSIAQQMEADPRGVLVAAIAGVTMSFVTPIATPPNVMILSGGGYKFKDFVKAGLPLALIGIIVSLLLIPILFPLFPKN